MSLNPYIIVFLITLAFTWVSYVFEMYNSNSINNFKECNSLGLFIFRFIHYTLLIYYTFFLLFFSPQHIDAIIYIILSTVLTCTWFWFECCIISYHELKCYNLDCQEYLTTFHPCLFVFFEEYQGYPLMISGIFMFFTFFYVLFKNEMIPFICKFIFGSIFFYLFMNNIIQTRYYNCSLNYPKETNHILYKYFTFV